VNRSANGKGGFGLIEVVIALAVLAIGVLAMAQLQVRALSFTSNAESMRTLTRVAEAEISWQQLNSLAGKASELSCAGSGCNECESDMPAGVTCRFDVVPCGVVDVNDVATFTCGMGVSSPQAYEIRLDIADQRGNAASFNTIATGRYVAGIMSDDAGGSGGGGNGEDEEAGPPSGGGGDGGTTTPPDDGENADDDRPGNRPPNVGGGNPNAPGRNR